MLKRLIPVNKYKCTDVYRYITEGSVMNLL